MPGGRRNPLSRMVEAMGSAKANAHDLTSVSVAQAFAQAKSGNISFVDIQIQFIGASGLPKMDVVGTADPYFVAKIDDKISFVSTVKSQTLAPVWNEQWRIKNVPVTAELQVEVIDKDDGAPHDDFVGKFKTSISPGAKEVEIEGSILKRTKGTFWLKIDSTPATDAHPSEFPYLFDGPIRFSQHHSPTAGLLTNLDEARLYSTWKVYLKGVPLIFRDNYQGWNRNYKAAQSIFQGHSSFAVRSGIQAGHRMLYARTSNNGFGVLESGADVAALLRSGRSSRPGPCDASRYANRMKPAVYTYIISAEDDSLRFSETGAAFFVDFASKHALHSNCAESVRYSGEFHPRPKGGWQNFTDDTQDEDMEWEMVVDNNSGTYSPDPALLPQLKELLEYNFPGFSFVALSFKDPKLTESTDACRAYAVNKRGVKEDELEPHTQPGEATLSHQASMVADAAGTATENVEVTVKDASRALQNVKESVKHATEKEFEAFVKSSRVQSQEAGRPPNVFGRTSFMTAAGRCK